MKEHTEREADVSGTKQGVSGETSEKRLEALQSAGNARNEASPGRCPACGNPGGAHECAEILRELTLPAPISLPPVTVEARVPRELVGEAGNREIAETAAPGALSGRWVTCDGDPDPHPYDDSTCRGLIQLVPAPAISLPPVEVGPLPHLVEALSQVTSDGEAQARRVTVNGDGYMECSACKGEFLFDLVDEFLIDRFPRFCPLCGAKFEARTNRDDVQDAAAGER